VWKFSKIRVVDQKILFCQSYVLNKLGGYCKKKVDKKGEKKPLAVYLIVSRAFPKRLWEKSVLQAHFTKCLGFYVPPTCFCDCFGAGM